MAKRTGKATICGIFYIHFLKCLFPVTCELCKIRGQILISFLPYILEATNNWDSVTKQETFKKMLLLLLEHLFLFSSAHRRHRKPWLPCSLIGGKVSQSICRAFHYCAACHGCPINCGNTAREVWRQGSQKTFPLGHISSKHLKSLTTEILPWTKKFNITESQSTEMSFTISRRISARTCLTFPVRSKNSRGAKP